MKKSGCEIILSVLFLPTTATATSAKATITAPVKATAGTATGIVKIQAGIG